MKNSLSSDVYAIIKAKMTKVSKARLCLYTGYGDIIISNFNGQCVPRRSYSQTDRIMIKLLTHGLSKA